jgi:hypothetical protein
MMLSKNMAGSIVSLVALLAVASFLIIGFTTDAWQLAWLVFLLIPVTAILVDIVSQKKNITNLVTGLVALLAILSYMVMGFFYSLWHPGWIVFLAIPISRVICNMFTGEGESKPDEPKPEDGK